MRTSVIALALSLSVLACGDALAASPAVGWLDVADQNGGAGWAYDPALGAAPATVEIRVDGKAVTTVTANGARPDLVTAGAAPEPDHGFAFALSGLSPGSHTIDAYALRGSTATRLSGSGKVVVIATTPSPTPASSSAIGFLDGADAYGAAGWAYDPALGASPVTVHIHADGRFLVATTANGPRPDLVAAGVAKEPDHGFSASLAGLAPGAHTIDAYAVTSSGEVKLVGSGKTVTVQAPPAPSPTTPIGFLDVADANVAAGWAYDPVAGAAPVMVHVYVDGLIFGATLANLPRPDLVAAGIAREAEHGFVASLAGLAPGKHHVDVYAIARMGDNPRLAGSDKIVTVPRTPIPGAPTVRTGAVESLSSDGVLSGTAFDPVVPGVSVQIWADGAAGKGRLVGTVSADGAAPTALGTLTAWRWVAPTYLRDGRPHALRVYSLDGAGQSPLELSGSPKTLQASPIALGDLELRGREVTITTSRAFGGAITGLTWNGLQFVNDDDHGRQIQTAWTVGYGERQNPTEAGSSSDGNLPSTRSVLVDARVTGSTLTTRGYPAFWVVPGGTSPNFGGVGLLTALNTTEVASDVFAKTVTVDVAGDPHLIRWDNELTLFADTPQLIVEAPTPYVEAVFSEYYTWDPATGAVAPLAHTPAGPDGWFKPGDAAGEQPLPIILATASGSHAIGIYSPEARTTYGRADFRMYAHTSKSDIVIRRERVAGGVPLELTSYLAVGTLDDVRRALTTAATTRP